MENLKKICFFYRMIYHDLMGEGETIAVQISDGLLQNKTNKSSIYLNALH
jgi:hypothetical protein